MPALGLEFERSLRAQPAEVRRVITTTLREAGFEVTAEQLTRVEAKRGSKWLSGALLPARSMPILAWFDIAPDPSGCGVAGHLVDQHLNLGGKAWGWNQTYQQLFGEILEALDRALARLDPQAGPLFPPARFWTKGGDIALLEQAQAAGSQAGTVVLGKANELLEGGSRDRGPTAWRGVGSVTFVSSKGHAVISLAETQAHLGVGVMVASQPGSLPANLADEVERFATRVEIALTGAQGGAVTVPVADPEVPVFEFLHQQVRIRDGLPVRTLHTCRTCHFQKVTNEDFARMQARNQRLRSLVGGVGAFVSPSGIQPFVVLGQLFRLKKLDPDYVCPRCQGLDADERIVTFCPSCGELRSEAVLRACGKCKHDFRDALGGETLWLTAEAAGALVAPPPGQAAGTAAYVPAGGWQPVSAGVAPAPVAASSPVATGWQTASPAAPAAPATDAAPWAASVTAPPVDPPTVPVAAPAGMAGSVAFCPFCATPIGPDYAFCPGCGTRLDMLAQYTGGPSA